MFPSSRRSYKFHSVPLISVAVKSGAMLPEGSCARAVVEIARTAKSMYMCFILFRFRGLFLNNYSIKWNTSIKFGSANLKKNC